MATLIAVPILGFLLILQSAVFSRIPLLGGTTDLVLLAVIAWALHKRVQTAWHWGIIGGLMVSYASALPFGAILLGYLLAVALALAFRGRIWQLPILAVLIATFFGTMIVHLITLLVLRLLGSELPLMQTLNLITLPSVLLNLLLALPFYALLGDLANWLYPKELEM
ncbi:MAG: rod shape-determining protein MreD [Anaerolineales bacterium]|nr:rod shape-determining protein MreD [Anaerolineales bacterium]